MKFLERIGATLAIAAAMTFGLPASLAQAAYTVTLQQQGSDVVATGTGTLDTTDLGEGVTDTDQARMNPMSGSLLIGPATIMNLGVFVSGITGPTSFGSRGTSENADSGSGDWVGILAGGGLVTPQDYLSGSELSSTATWVNQTFNSLGVAPGSYTWIWGSGVHSDFLTFDIIEGATAVPEPSSILLLALPLGLVVLLTRLLRSISVISYGNSNP